MKKNLKKIVAGFVVIGTFIAYVISQNNTNSGNSNNSVSDISTSSSQNSSSQDTTNISVDNVTVPTVIPKTVPKVVKKGLFTDGTYTGNVADAYYGNIQVQAVVKNGKLADVIFLQHPNDRSTSIYINNMAMPQLKSEAIAVQSSSVNAISGASETSRAFVESLQSALNQAKA